MENREGAQIYMRNWVCGQEDVYTAFTAADGSWTMPNIKVYGVYGGYWNYLDFSMANQWQSIYAISDNTASPTPRISISGLTGNSGGVTFDNGSCGSSSWSAGASTSITITGTTTVQNGTMRFTDTLNRQGQVPIVNGSFTISSIPVYNGSENYINIYNYDDPAGYSSHSLYITTTNGAAKPQFVTVTSPAHGTNGLTGVQTISGTITDTIGTGFSGANGQIYAQVYACGTWSYFTNDTWMQTNYGYGPATLNADNFSFSADFCGVAGAEPVNVYVSVYDYNTSSSHYHEVYYNYGLSPPAQRYNKAGLRSPAVNDVRRLRDMQAVEHYLRVMPE